MITQGLFNVEFSMPGHFGEGTVVIDDPSLLTDALAQFARIQRETADILEIPAETAVTNNFLEHGMSLIAKPFAIDTLAAQVRDLLQDC